MSFRANSCFAAEIPCNAAAIPCFRRNRELMSNILICQEIKPRRQPEKRRIRRIFNNSLLNSLVSGNCGGRKRGRCVEIFGASVEHLSDGEGK